MKRWQTRGEVQDSDEEELSLDVDSQSPGHALKRIKIDQQQKNDIQDEDHARSPGSAGQLPESVKPVSLPRLSLGEIEGLESVQRNVSGPPQEKDDEPGWTSRSHESVYGRVTRSVQQGNHEARGLVPVIPRTEQHAVGLEDVPMAYDDISSSAPMAREETVSLEQAPASKDAAAGEIPTADQTSAQEPASVASSPLSELSDPPDSPPTFLDLAADSTNRLLPIMNNQSSNGDHSGDVFELPSLLLTQGARRSLRARQEKQLHPYMYDKAQYQRQCRERGLRPVRLMEQMANETQDASLNDDNMQPSSSATQPSSSSSHIGSLVSSGLPPDGSFDINLGYAPPHNAEEELPDIDRLLKSRATAGRLRSRKRQKVSHGTKTRRDAAIQLIHQDDFSVPPSPPLSSHGSMPETQHAPQGFRLPRRFSPLPLPTPQISSDLRPSHGGDTAALSEDDTPPRTSRRLRRVRSAVTIGTDTSAGSESQSEDDQRLLHREQRRIKGVLPASWLNIDRKSRPLPPAQTHDRVGNKPGPQATPQKGVARMIHRTTQNGTRPNVLEISDGGEGSESDNPTPTVPEEMPSHTVSNVAREASVDSDEMEVDWFDPMLAGQPRDRNASRNKGKRHPRITEALKHNVVPDFSEERNGLKQMHRSKRSGTKRRPNANPSSKQRRRVPQLGILDAPKSPSAVGGKEPQFVRLAARQARRGPNGGRHSPSHKIVRLATHDDTEEANATLESWRRGRIEQRIFADTSRDQQHSNHGEARGRSLPTTPFTDLVNRSNDRSTASLSKDAVLNSAVAESPSTHATSKPQGALDPAQTPAKRQNPSKRRSLATRSSHTLQRNLGSGKTQPGVQYRGAQLEAQESAYLQENRSVAFQRRIQILTETVARRPATPAPGELPIERFLHEPSTAPTVRDASGASDLQPSVPAVSKARVTRRPRKRIPQRIEVDTREYRQPSEPLPISYPEQNTEDTRLVDSERVVQGLGPSGTRYAIDFDIRHLPKSSYFHQSTFIGSGDLAAALALGKRQFDRSTGSLRISINGSMREWSEWSEEVDAAMADIPTAISAIIQPSENTSPPLHQDHINSVALNVDHMLRSTIRYISSCLYFLDAVDRKNCCQRLMLVVQDLLEILDDVQRWSTDFRNVRQRTLQYALVLVRQNEIISDNALISESMRGGIREQVDKVASRLAAFFVPDRLSDLRDAYEEQRTLSKREAGIRDDDSAIAGMVILHHCLQAPSENQSMFWAVVRKALRADAANSNDSRTIDNLWYSIFTVLPSLEIDWNGFVQSNRNEASEVDWSLPRNLVDRCLELYPASSKIRGSSINEYVRASLMRCSGLFATWHWWKCESLLHLIYDFFARRNLSLLHNEEGNGSPDFLDNLKDLDNISLELAPDDRSFSIFLKMLAGALRTWSEQAVYTNKKIGGIAWRMIPNHARIYRKDAEVRQADLDALRNHFDLLCTLFSASPPMYRLRVDMLRNLVDHSTSHREACRISVRAWSRLASFQASRSEPLNALGPFVEWFKDMLQITAAQYRLARTEAEQQYAEAKAQGEVAINDELLERTIASNQRQIAATLVDLFAAFRQAVTSTSTIDGLRYLVEFCEPWKALDSFDLSERRLISVYKEALDLAKAAIDTQRRHRPPSHAQASSEDSQDYGDFSILQEFAIDQNASQNNEEADTVALIHDNVAQLVSNAFGSETSPDDGLLARLIDVWIELAKHLTSKGLRSWSNFVDDYSPGAWYQLRDTAQHRKFTPYILARILEADLNSFDSLKQTFLSAWMKSLVERESNLKYQHLMTAALLNVLSDEPLLENLPFVKSDSATHSEVTLQELRQRRLGLISSVLSNMSQHFDQVHFQEPRSVPQIRRSYSDILRQLMQAMKSNYQDLQLSQSVESAASGVQGAYVVFVQDVVSFLQQYTHDICPVDRFFLDSSAFPLPAADPTYVIGKLRRFVSKLAEEKTRKTLVTFLHTVSERAALDNQQTYLADQFFKAMSGTDELGDPEAPSLRHIVLTSVFPAYIETALKSACTWIFALPMLEASSMTVANLLYDTIFENNNSIAAVVEQLAAILGAVQKSLAWVLVHLDVLNAPHVLKTLGVMVRLCDATVVVSNHIQRSSGVAAPVLEQLRALQAQMARLEEQLTVPDEFADVFMDDLQPDTLTTSWPETFAFTARQVQQSSKNDWHAVGDRFFVRRGNSSKEVVLDVGAFSEERDQLLEAVTAFRSSCSAQRNRRRRRRN